MTVLYLEALAARCGRSRARPPLSGSGWLAYPVIGLATDYVWGWVTLLAPLFMYWIPVYVTGIPPLEQQMLRSRGERYRDYQSRTSMFFPLPPQKGVVT